MGLDHIAINEDAAFPQAGEIGHGAQRSADEALDLMRPAADASLGRFARRTRERGARNHGVLAGDPALAAVSPEGAHAFFHGCRTNYARVAHPAQRLALAVGHVI